ncbi:MAG: preprotein translocase subunit YajC [Clostridia bacterium]|nr:preprotein translocase subunit YajC [Clostridia bacterium]
MFSYFLDEASSAANAGNMGPMGGMSTILMLVVIFIAMYFIVIRPQKKQEKEKAQMLNNLQVGDEITTIGGIIGKVISIKEETCMIETGKDKTRIRILKSSVARVDVRAEDSVG